MVYESQKNNLKSSIDFLKPGDLVDIIAPASACPQTTLEAGIKWLEAQGFRVRVQPDMLKPDLYLSNSDENRYRFLENALTVKDSKAIWCIRGGYGCARLIPRLLKLPVQAPKLFIGLSDITTLHIFLNTKWNWPTLHASLLDRLADHVLPVENETELLRLIRGETIATEFVDLKPMNAAAENLGRQAPLEGRITGGNLTVVCSQVGTPNEELVADNFLFFEDRGERGYRIDRMLQQIRQSQILAGTRAILLGEFTEGQEPNGQNHVEVTWTRFSEEISIPVFSGIPCGHGLIQRPIFFNTKAEIFHDANFKLKVYNTAL